MPTTSLRRPISLLTRLERVRAAELGPVLARERVERDQVFLGVLEQVADLWCGRLQTTDDLGRTVAGLVAVFGVEDLSRGGGDQAALVAAAVREHVADE